MQAYGSKYEKADPGFARKVKNHFYVDINTAVYNTDEGFELYKNLKVRFLEANFRKLESGERMTKIYVN